MWMEVDGDCFTLKNGSALTEFSSMTSRSRFHRLFLFVSLMTWLKLSARVEFCFAPSPPSPPPSPIIPLTFRGSMVF